MLFLSAETIEKAVNCVELMDAIEEAYRLFEAGEIDVPLRTHLDRGENTLLLMPCFGTESFATKLVTVFPGASDYGAPVINGVVVLNDGETGAPVALIDGRSLTAQRTGAVGGLSVRHMAAPDASTLGVVGAGVQGYHQALFAAAARDLTKIIAFDIDAQASRSFVDDLSSELDSVEVSAASRVEELLEAADTVVTTTTAARPVLPDEPALLQGKHFVGVGSFKPNMREFPSSLYELVDEVVVDTEHALEESGDVVVPLRENWLHEDQVVTMVQYLAEGRKPQDRAETTFFKSVGLALFDLAAAQLVFERAQAEGLGQQLEL